MFNYFIFDGHDSRDYGVYISGGGTFNSPARRYENISVPGRDGDLLGASTRLQNVTLTYPAGVVSDFAANIEGLRNMLLSTVGYAVLYDSYHPDEYRYAVYKGGLEQDPLSNLQAGEFEVTFECKPQRYLFSGGEARDLGAWGEVTELTGDIVTFEGAADTGIKSLTVQIEPVQNGSGDPSPSNIRPISGHTDVVVTRTGKNLLKYPYSDGTKTQNGVTFTVNSDGTVTINGTASANTAFSLQSEGILLKPGTYTAKTLGSGGGSSSYSIRVYRSSGTIGYAYGSDYTFTLTADEYISFQIYVYKNYVASNVKLSPCLFYGATSQDYEPYQGDTLSLPLPTAAGTVYGGTLDVTEGKLTVTHGIVDIGDATWYRTTSYTNPLFYVSLSGKASDYRGGACSAFKNISSSAIASASRFGSDSSNGDFALSAGNSQIYVRWDAITDATTFKTTFTGQKIVYPLATPIEYTLTPEQITTLKGYNNIWSDAGPITLEYGKDPGKLTNPTLFDARPVFRVFGYGTLNVGNQTVTIAQNPLDYIDIDSALMDCYCGATNANQYVTFSGNDFPVLPPGVTSITFSNTITRVLVTTNWWRV